MAIFLSFLPWIVFWILSGPYHYQIAALAATLVVILLNIRNIKRRSIKILDMGTLIFFVVLTGISFLSKSTWIDHYSAPVSSAVMFFIAALSLAIRKPFTIQYAYEQVEPEYWDSPQFYATNRTITMVWCIAFAINSFFSYLYVGHPYKVDWVIIILVIVAAVKFTAWYPDFVESKDRQKEAQPEQMDEEN